MKSRARVDVRIRTGVKRMSQMSQRRQLGDGIRHTRIREHYGTLSRSQAPANLLKAEFAQMNRPSTRRLVLRTQAPCAYNQAHARNGKGA